MRVHLPDLAPILQVGPYTVLAERHDVEFRDGSSVGLHQVSHQGTTSTTLRCVVHGSGPTGHTALIVDVRQFSRPLGGELCVAQQRDVQGLVFWHLRLRYPCAADFIGAALTLVLSAAPLEAPLLRPEALRQVSLFDADPVPAELLEHRYAAAPASITTAITTAA